MCANFPFSDVIITCQIKYRLYCKDPCSPGKTVSYFMVMRLLSTIFTLKQHINSLRGKSRHGNRREDSSNTDKYIFKNSHLIIINLKDGNISSQSPTVRYLFCEERTIITIQSFGVENSTVIALNILYSRCNLCMPPE